MLYFQNSRRLSAFPFFLSVCLGLFVFSSSLSAVGVSMQIPGKSPKEIKPLLEQTFQRIKAPYRFNPVSLGFAYRIQAKAPTAFWYSAFVGEYEGGSILRFDSYNNTARALANVFASDHLKANYEKKYKRKSFALTYLLTLIEPAFGVAYARSHNPLTSMPLWMSTSITLGVDILLFFMGSTTFFTHKIDPFGKGLIATTVLLSTHRLYHIVDLTISLAASNRLVKMGYTFNY